MYESMNGKAGRCMETGNFLPISVCISNAVLLPRRLILSSVVFLNFVDGSLLCSHECCIAFVTGEEDGGRVFSVRNKPEMFD